MRQFLTRMGATLVLLAIAIVPPLVIVRMIGRPWPQWSQLIDEFDAGRVSTDTTMRVAACAALVLWSFTMLVIAREVRVVLGERRHPDFVATSAATGAGPIRRLVRLMLAGSVTTAAAVSTLAPAAVVGFFHQHSVTPAVDPQPTSALLVDSADVAAPTDDSFDVITATGRQTPLSIAAKLGDESLRDQIIELNRNDDWGGGVFPAGMQIRVPRIEQPPQTDVVSAGTTSYTVRAGDGMWDVAEALVGDGSRYREVAAQLRGQEVAPGVFFDASMRTVHPGWVFSLDTSSSASSVAEQIDVATTYVVRSGDTLSKIAEQRYGSGDQWTVLWEANAHHDMGDGRTFDDPNLIMPGWELAVPVEVGTPLTVDEVVPPPPPPVVPAPSVDAAPASIPDAGTTAAPAIDAPPPPPTQPPASVAPAATPTPSTTPMPVTTAAPSPSAAPAPSAASHTDAAMRTGAGAAALLAVGALGLMEARRRQQLRRASVAARLAARSEESVALESALRVVSGGERLARLDLAIRVAAPDMAAQGCRLIAATVADTGEVTMLTDVAAAPTDPTFGYDAAHHAWTLAADVTLEALAERTRNTHQPCPALVHIGNTGDQQLYVDLEAIGVLAVDAAPPQAADIVRSITASLAVSPFIEAGRLMSVGFDASTYLGSLNAEVASSPHHALHDAVEILGSTPAAAASGAGTFALRARQHGGEAWEPVVLCVTNHELPAEFVGAALRAAGTGGQGLAVVVDRFVEGAPWVLRPVDGQFRLLPLDLAVTPNGLSADEVAEVQGLITEAEQPLPEAAPVVSLHVDDEDPSPWVEPEWSLQVKMLGAVDVVDADGRSAVFERSKAMELVVWLGLHRDYPTRSKARNALWELDVRDATFANVVSDARRGMARLVSPPDGEEWIGRTLTENLPLHERVLTDADLLEARLDYVRNLPALDVVEVLRPGVELVSGLPFAGTSYLWTDAEGLPSSMILLTTAACTVLGQAYLALGDTEGVFWATGRGLKVLAGHEELIGLRMRAHANAGDLSGVRQEWEAYERALHADQWSSGEPSPKLVELRRELLAPSMAG
jgi:nucleoid-associated protein YgaU